MSTIAIPSKAGSPSGDRQPLVAWLALAGATVLVYGKVLTDLAKDMWGRDDYSHGILIPFALAYLIHQKRDYVRQLPLRQSAFGLVVVLGSQFINLVGFLGAEFFLQRISFVFFVAGLILFVYGWKHLWESAFALLLLVLAIPLPTIVFNAVALPLQLIASVFAERILQLLDIPVLREGNILSLATMQLSVAEACSGIRSLMSLITLGVMVAYFLPYRWWVRSLFIVSTIPVAVVTNAFRVGGTGVLAHHYGIKAAEGFFHTFSGWLVFVCAFVILIAEVALIRKLDWGRIEEKGTIA
jgi:exosortase